MLVLVRMLMHAHARASTRTHTYSIPMYELCSHCKVPGYTSSLTLALPASGSVRHFWCNAVKQSALQRRGARVCWPALRSYKPIQSALFIALP